MNCISSICTRVQQSVIIMLSELSIGNHKLYISTTKHKHKRRRPTILEIYLNIIGTVFPIYYEEKLKKKIWKKREGVNGI